MSAASVAARRAEVAQRYSKAAKMAGGNLRLGEVRRLLRGRGLGDLAIAGMIANLGELRPWPAAALGERLKLTFEEKIRHGIRTIQCIDKSPADVDAYYRERKRRRDRIRIARKRAAEPPRETKLSARADDLLDELTGRGWVSRSDLVSALAGVRSFRNDRGRQLDGDARRQAVHRALGELLEARVVDEREDFSGRRRIKKVRIRV